MREREIERDLIQIRRMSKESERLSLICVSMRVQTGGESENYGSLKSPLKLIGERLLNF